MKKMIAFLAAVCLFAFTACSGGEPQSSHTPEPTPSATPAPVSDEQAVEAVRIDIEAALDYVNENDDIDGATKFSNAILNGTSYEIVFADKDKCEVIFRYPDAEAFLLKASEQLNDNSTEEEIDAVFAQIAEEITDEDSRVIKTVTAEIDINSNGRYSIIWNDDFYDAVSGGLYSMQIEEGE